MLLLILLNYTIPFDSPIIDNIEYLEIKGVIDSPSIRPYELEWIIPQLDELLMNDIELTEVDRRIISSFNPLLLKNMDFSSLFHFKGAYENNPEYYYGFLDFRSGGRLSKYIRYSHALRFQRASETDSFGPKPWNGFQVYLTEGLVKLNIGNIKFDFGRRNLLLGLDNKNGLLLSLDPQGYDGFLLFIPSRYLEFSNIFSILNASENRYLAIHRIGFNIRKFLKLGFSEAVVFGRALEPLYLNCFLPYYLSQWGADRDDNIVWCLDIQLRLFGSIFYSEFLIDDYMYEDDPYPDKLALKLGLKSVVFNKFLISTNYTYVDKWVYTQEHRVNVYEHNGYPLGFPLGNDVDNFFFSVKFMNKFGLYPRMEFNYTRKGEGSIFLPYEEEGGSWNPPFPSGVVEKKIEGKIGLDYIFRYNFYVKIDVGKRYWKNYDHIESDDRDDTIFSVALWAVL